MELGGRRGWDLYRDEQLGSGCPTHAPQSFAATLSSPPLSLSLAPPLSSAAAAHGYAALFPSSSAPLSSIDLGFGLLLGDCCCSSARSIDAAS